MSENNQTITASDDLEAVKALQDAYTAIKAQLAQVIVGQDQVIEELLIALFSKGHCLLEGVPGLAKTLMISTLARTLSLDFSRIQFTPDLMPADITGTEVIQENRDNGSREFKFLKGPLFSNVILADEISPDTCRLWDKNTLKKLDKDRFRRDLGDVREAYVEILQRLKK